MYMAKMVMIVLIGFIILLAYTTIKTWIVDFRLYSRFLFSGSDFSKAYFMHYSKMDAISFLSFVPSVTYFAIKIWIILVRYCVYFKKSII